MRWQRKAQIMRLCSTLPFGASLYKVGQRYVGHLNQGATGRYPTAVQMATWLVRSERPIAGQTMLEVGTGHNPMLPIVFFLLGARRVLTYDLHRRLDRRLVTKSLRWMAEERTKIQAELEDLAPSAELKNRLELVARSVERPLEFLNAAGIEYHAPVDAAATGLPATSVDVHFSCTVFEHIPPSALAAILKEAHRVIRRDGAAIHFVDLSDHFQHQDPSIPRIHFLRYSDRDWERMAGNEFAYCNRLRRDDYVGLFAAAGFSVIKQESSTDEESLAALADGFPLDPKFAGRDPEELCTTSLRVLLRPR
jgi:hypothetical protein